MNRFGWIAALAVTCSAGPAWAQADGGLEEGVQQDPMPDEAPQLPPEPEPEPRRRRRSKPVHDPQGRLLVGGTIGGIYSNDQFSVLLGAQVGYSVIDGLVPGVRGQVFFGGFSGGEAAGNLMYTPPLSLPVVPFFVFDSGYRWEGSFEGPILGGGGGLHLGAPGARFNMRAGVLYHRWFVNDLPGPTLQDVDIIRPVLIFSFSI